jgi:hypothetical protein
MLPSIRVLRYPTLRLNCPCLGIWDRLNWGLQSRKALERMDEMDNMIGNSVLARTPRTPSLNFRGVAYLLVLFMYIASVGQAFV